MELTQLSIDLYLKPFSAPLRSAFRSKELRELHSVLLEKGLRIRLELDTFAEGWSSEVEDLHDSTEDVADEVEAMLGERELLKPF